MFRAALVTTWGVALALLPALGACGSSSTSHPDAGSSSGSSSGAGSGSGGSSGGMTGCMALAAVPSGDVPAYAKVAPVLNSCTAAQIQAYDAACGATGSNSACMTWEGDPNNSKCYVCLIPQIAGTPTNAGALLIDASGMFIVAINQPGCVALRDTSMGPTCAAALEPLIQCEAYACPNCTDQATADSCRNAADLGACAQYLASFNTSCQADFGDGGLGNTTCADPVGVINTICGTGQ